METLYALWYWISDFVYDQKCKLYDLWCRLNCGWRGCVPIEQQPGSCWDPDVEVVCDRCGRYM